jgi:ABC-type spermidine/putrescine transport system permease subunit II
VRSLPLYIVVAAVFAFLFAPIALVLVNSFNSDPDLVHWGGFTTRWYGVARDDPLVVSAAWQSFKIACLSTAVACVLGTLGALGLRGSGRLLRTASDITTYGRLIMPELVLAIGLLLMFRALNVSLGVTTIVVGHVTLFTAYAVIIVSARLAGRDPSTEEAARDLGATALRTFWRVTLPEIAPAILASALLIFTFSMDNVVTSLFLSSGVNTLPLVLFSMIRLRVTPEVNAIATLVVLATALLLAVFLAIVAGRATMVGLSPRGTRRKR